MAPNEKANAERNPRERVQARSGGEHDRRVLAMAFVGLFALAAIAYYNADHDEYLFDSYESPIQNRQSEPAYAIRHFFDHPLHPHQIVTFLTFGLNRLINDWLGYDECELTTMLITNVLLHALSACLIVLLIRALYRARDDTRPPPLWIPILVGVLFVVHPIHASSVAYIIQRRSELITLFWVLAVLAYLHARRSPQNLTPRGVDAASTAVARRWPMHRVAAGLAVIVCYWLSYRSKPAALPFPILLLLIEFCLRAGDRRARRAYLKVLIPGLLLSIGAMFTYAWSYGLFDPWTLTIKPWGGHGDPWSHFLTSSRAFVGYWKLLILPLPRWSCIDHEVAMSHSLTEHMAWLAILFHAVVLIAAVVAAYRGWTLASIGVFWFYVAMIPYAVLPQPELLVEYKTYLPSVGLALIVAELLLRLRFRVPVAAITTGVGVVAILLLATTIRRNVIYQTSFNLWSDAVSKAPDNPRAQSNFADALSKAERYREALEHYDIAFDLAPYYFKAYNNRGNALRGLARYAEAIESYRMALKIYPDYARAHFNLGSALGATGRTDEAIEQYQAAIRRDPKFAEAHSNLAMIYVERGRIEESLGEFKKAVDANPRDVNLRSNLGNAYVQAGRYPEALAVFDEALRRAPDDAQLQYNRAIALDEAGRLRDAEAGYRRALQLDPEYRKAALQLVSVLHARGDARAALRELQQWLAHHSDDVEALFVLGRLYEKLGQPDDAAKAYNRVLWLDPTHAGARARLGAMQTPPHANP